MRAVLAFDTSGPVIGVAAWCQGATAVRTERVARGAESRLLVFAQAVLDELGIGPDAVDGVAVTEGPGAFTGLRVGLATASGLAVARGVPMWTTGSLDTRSARVAHTGPVLSMLDARKGKLYAQLVDGGSVVQGPADLPPEAVWAWLDGCAPGQATGEGSVVHAEALAARGWSVVDDAAHPAVDTLATLAASAFAQGQGTDARTIQPRYLRAPDAKVPRGQEVG